MEGPFKRNEGSQEGQSQPPAAEQRGLVGRGAYPPMVTLGWGEPKVAIEHYLPLLQSVTILGLSLHRRHLTHRGCLKESQ